jgi:hypothetical protein
MNSGQEMRRLQRDHYDFYITARDHGDNIYEHGYDTLVANKGTHVIV